MLTGLHPVKMTTGSGNVVRSSPGEDVDRGECSNSRTQVSPRLVTKWLASDCWNEEQTATPDAGETTSNLTVIGSNPIRRASGGSSMVEQQRCLATVCRHFIEGLN